MEKPKTKKENVYDEIHGIKILDPYRWLENAESPEIKEWIREQNEYTFSKLKDENFEIFSDELTKNRKSSGFTNFVVVKGKYFYREIKPEEDQLSLYVREGLDGNPIKLVDPNGIREDNAVSIAFWSVSSSGKYLVYGISEGGNEMATLYIKNVETKENLQESIVNCRYSNVQWLSDDSGFYYTRNPRPLEVPENEMHLHTKLYFHKLGDNPDDDKLIFGKDRPKDDTILLDKSMDDKYLAIHISKDWLENEIYLYNIETEETKLIIGNIPSKFKLRFLSDKALIITNYKANNYRILSAPLDEIEKHIDKWEVFVEERDSLLESFSFSSNKILTVYTVDVSSKVEVLNYDGKKIGDLPLPQYSSILSISSQGDDEFFIMITSFTFSRIMYCYNSKINSCEKIREVTSIMNPDDYVIKQEWFESKDGTNVPMFIIHKKGLPENTPCPTVLSGYGGLGMVETPYFLKKWISWLERGGIFAFASIRGGGEFGESWHKSGIKENKQNSFDDFISGAEYLIEKNYTSSELLGITGGSNGGLLVSAVAVQRPDLYKAVVPIVPLTDMVRFPQFGIAIRWVHEHGDPQIKEELENILKWSPYHSVKEDAKYPNFLFITAEKDTRVDPLHARKMTAILQSVEKENDVLIFTDTEAGHGAGKPVKKVIGNQALVLSFFADKLGLKI